MRLSIIVVIAVLAIGISIISIGFFITQQVEEVVTTITPYEQLENYREELEKINQYNQQLLTDLENQIVNSDDVHIEQLKKEIEVLKQVIDDNKKELDQVIERLSKMKEQ